MLHYLKEDYLNQVVEATESGGVHIITMGDKEIAILHVDNPKALKRLISALNDFVDEEYQKGMEKLEIGNPPGFRGSGDDYRAIKVGCFDDHGLLSAGRVFYLADFL